MSTQFVRVAFCMNDPDNGEPQGFASSVHFDAMGANAAEWESGEIFGGPVCRHQPALSRIKVSRCVFPVRQWSLWVGNWCWNEATMQVEDALRLRTLLQKLGWSCTMHVVGSLFQSRDQGKVSA